MTLWVNGAVTNHWRECEVKKGYVGLEAEGYRIEFRNVKLKPLGDTAPPEPDAVVDVGPLIVTFVDIENTFVTSPGDRAVMRRFAILCVCLGTLGAMSAARAEIQVGAAMRVITPDPLLPVSGGMGIPKPSREKRGDLTARAIVVRKGDVPRWPSCPST